MQIKVSKPINKTNHLLIPNDQQPTPKRSISRNRLPPKVAERQIPKQNQPLISNTAPRSPARSASKTTAKSKDNSFSIVQNRSRPKSKRTMNVAPSIRQCQNHQQQIGSFNIQIEGEKLYYCQRCAYKLKNQGFPVKKQHQISIGSFRQQSQEISMSYAHLKGNLQFQTLKILLGQIYTAQTKIQVSQNSSMEMEELFNTKITEIQRFYSRIEQLISESRQKSVSMLRELKEAWKCRDIQQKGKFNSLQVLKDMKVDIEGNIEQIVGEVDEETFKVCVDDYRQRLQFLTSKAQSKLYETDKIKNSLSSKVEQELNQFESNLAQMRRTPLQVFDQNVITSQCDVNYDCQIKEVSKSSFQHQINCEKQKNRKKIMSRK